MLHCSCSVAYPGTPDPSIGVSSRNLSQVSSCMKTSASIPGRLGHIIGYALFSCVCGESSVGLNGPAAVGVLTRYSSQRLLMVFLHFELLGLMSDMESITLIAARISRRQSSEATANGSFLKQIIGINEAWKRKYL